MALVMVLDPGLSGGLFEIAVEDHHEFVSSHDEQYLPSDPTR